MGGGASHVNHHDGIFLREGHRVALVRPFVVLRSPGERPQGHEASHHATILDLVMATSFWPLSLLAGGATTLA
jgi:hypothetical protein